VPCGATHRGLVLEQGLVNFKVPVLVDSKSVLHDGKMCKSNIRYHDSEHVVVGRSILDHYNVRLGGGVIGVVNKAELTPKYQAIVPESKCWVFEDHGRPGQMKWTWRRLIGAEISDASKCLTIVRVNGAKFDLWYHKGHPRSEPDLGDWVGRPDIEIAYDGSVTVTEVHDQMRYRASKDTDAETGVRVIQFDTDFKRYKWIERKDGEWYEAAPSEGRIDSDEFVVERADWGRHFQQLLTRKTDSLEDRWRRTERSIFFGNPALEMTADNHLVLRAVADGITEYVMHTRGDSFELGRQIERFVVWYAAEGLIEFVRVIGAPRFDAEFEFGPSGGPPKILENENGYFEMTLFATPRTERDVVGSIVIDDVELDGFPEVVATGTGFQIQGGSDKDRKFYMKCEGGEDRANLVFYPIQPRFYAQRTLRLGGSLIEFEQVLGDAIPGEFSLISFDYQISLDGNDYVMQMYDVQMYPGESARLFGRTETWYGVPQLTYDPATRGLILASEPGSEDQAFLIIQEVYGAGNMKLRFRPF
jgi:hypothetical protein